MKSEKRMEKRVEFQTEVQLKFRSTVQKYETMESDCRIF